jgi:CubicO group peptidase (beta-lactamase class C family)
MLGGIGGHAGLFSNANDMAKYFQMLLNGGSYGGVQFFLPSTVKEFTRQQFQGNRRALAFDKPVSGGNGPTCDAASANSFGHTGFTGTMAWADPDNGLIYIFLSNRVYPDSENKLLQSMDIRPRIQQVIYDAFKGK